LAMQIYPETLDMATVCAEKSSNK
jgi:hypothetical protein